MSKHMDITLTKRNTSHSSCFSISKYKKQVELGDNEI